MSAQQLVLFQVKSGGVGKESAQQWGCIKVKMDYGFGVFVPVAKQDSSYNKGIMLVGF